MAYIGKDLNNLGDVQTLDNITFTNSAGPYNLQKNSVQVTNADTDSILISIDGVVQGGNYTVNASAGTITFDFSVSASSTCDWIKLYGTGVQLTPKDNSVTTVKLASGSITPAKFSTSGISAGNVIKVNDAGTAWELGAASSAEIYGFSKDSNGDLIVTTTNQGQDDISSATYATFDDVLFSASGFTFSIVNGELIATI